MTQEPLWWQRARDLHAMGFDRGKIARMCGKSRWSVGYVLNAGIRERNRARAKAWFAENSTKRHRTPEQLARHRIVAMARAESRETGRHIDDVLVRWETHPRRGRAAARSIHVKDITLIHGNSGNTALLDDMFRQRARVFHGKMRWSVTVENGRERDKYDNYFPVYILHTTDGKLTGSLRLMSTLFPTLLFDRFFDTIPKNLRPSGTVWECTRFCAESPEAAPSLIAGMGEFCLSNGIESVVGNFDRSMLRIYRRLGCEVVLLGKTRKYGSTVYLGKFPVTQDILATVKTRIGG